MYIVGVKKSLAVLGEGRFSFFFSNVNFLYGGRGFFLGPYAKSCVQTYYRPIGENTRRINCYLLKYIFKPRDLIALEALDAVVVVEVHLLQLLHLLIHSRT